VAQRIKRKTYDERYPYRLMVGRDGDEYILSGGHRTWQAAERALQKAREEMHENNPEAYIYIVDAEGRRLTSNYTAYNS